MNYRSASRRAFALATLLLWAVTAQGAAAWYNSAWTNRIAVTIDRTKVSGTLTNFPVLINLTNSSLQQYAQADADDILFTSSDGTTKLSHEIESYTSSTGALVAWVKVPTLASSSDTVLYLYFRNPAASNQQNASGVWDSNFKAIWHLKEDASGTGTSGLYTDSSSNGNAATDYTASTVKTGRIGSGQGFNGSSDYLRAAHSSSLNISGQITLSAWVNYNEFVWDGNYGYIVGKGYNNENGEAFYLRTQRYPGGSAHALAVGSYYGSDFNAVWSITGWNTNEWHHVVGLYDGTNWRLFVDGVQKTNTAKGTGALTNSVVTTVGAMENLGSLSRYSNAKIDEVRISNVARSSSWIATEYNNQNSPGAFFTIGSAEVETPPTRLAIASVNGGANPTYGTSFSVVVEAQDAGGTARTVTSDTAVTLSLNTGSGTLGGTVTGTITSGSSSVTISGVTYSKAESGVILTASRTSGMTLTAGNSSAFTLQPKAITVLSGLTANNKTYNASTAATINSNNVTFSGVTVADTANVKLSTNDYTAAFSSATVGTGKSVSVSGLTLTGSAAGNYTITAPTLSANITAAPVTVASGLTANTKVFDGTTTATISSNSVSLSGVLDADTANVRLSTNGYTASFATANPGSGKPVTVTGLTLTGSAAGNYSLTQPTLSATITAVSWQSASWPYRLAIVIDRSRVSGPLTNFPVLINLTNSLVQQHAQADGDDLLFTSSDGATRLAHEIESYTSASGTLVAWVNVPLLSSTTNTILFLYFGNPTATNQQNIPGTWNSNFRAVWHLNGVFTDSTTNNHHGASTGTTAATGKISNGRGFVRADGDDYIAVNGLLGSPSNVTLSAWANLNSRDVSGAEVINLGDCVALRLDDSYFNASFGFFYNGSYWENTAVSTNYAGTSWRHLAWTHDDAGNAQRLYVDGVAVVSNAYTGSIFYSGLGTNTFIGRHANGDPDFAFDGTIDEVRVSTVARSASWVATEFNNQSSPGTFCTASIQETNPPAQLVITSVNGGSNPTAGAAFSVVVQAQDTNNTARVVTSDTTFALSLNTGSGTLGGTLTGTITNGGSSLTITGVTYTKAESSVRLAATATGGMSLTTATSSTFTVNAGALHHFSFGSIGTQVVGATFDVVITAVDQYENAVTSFSSNVVFTTTAGTVSPTTSSSFTSGVRTQSVSVSQAGSNQTITATRNGGSESGISETFTVDKGATALALTSSANPSPTGSNVTFTATVSVVAPSSGTRIGNVQFKSDGVALGSAVALSPDGVAALTTSALAHGTHTISAEYSGSSNFLPSTNTLNPNQAINATPIAATPVWRRHPTAGVKVRAATLLADCTDWENDGLQLNSFNATSAQGGTVITNAGWIIYQPPASFTNADSFAYVIADSGGLQSTGSVSIAIVEDLAPAENINALDDLGNGSTRVRFQGVPHRAYSIQCATNAQSPTWQTLGTTSADARGCYEFTDTPPANSPSRIYRSTH